MPTHTTGSNCYYTLKHFYYQEKEEERETGEEGKREKERLMDIVCIINERKKPFLMEYLVSERGEERERGRARK